MKVRLSKNVSPGNGLSPDSRSANAMVLDFQPPEPWEMFAVYKPPRFWYFVIAAQAG